MQILGRVLSSMWVILCILAVSPPAATGAGFEDSTRSYARIHLSVVTGWSYTAAAGDIQSAFRESGFSGISWWGGVYPLDRSKHWSHTVEASYRLANHWYLGAGVKGVPSVDIVGYGSVLARSESEKASGTTFYILARYVPRPYGYWSSSQWEVGLGVGLSYSRLSIEGDLGSRFEGGTIVQSIPFSVTTSKFGAVIRGDIDRYVGQSVSVKLAITGFLMPSVEVPAQTSLAKKLVAHRVNFSSFKIGMGLVLHL